MRKDRGIRGKVLKCMRENPDFPPKEIAAIVGCSSGYAWIVMSDRDSIKHQFDRREDEYCGAMLECQQICDKLGFTFREIVGGLVNKWNSDNR